MDDARGGGGAFSGPAPLAAAETECRFHMADSSPDISCVRLVQCYLRIGAELRGCHFGLSRISLTVTLGIGSALARHLATTASARAAEHASKR
jgi:hypothetical protein